MIHLRFIRPRLPRSPSFGAEVFFGTLVLALAAALGAGFAMRQIERHYLDRLLASESGHKFQLLISASRVKGNIGLLERATTGHSLLIAGTVGIICFLLGLLAFLAIRHFAVVPIARMAERLGELQRGVCDRPLRLTAFAPAELHSLNASIDSLGESIAQKKRRHKERTDAQEAAISASRTNSEFLANMSRELRAPLNAIIGFSEVMGQRTFGPLGHKKYEEYAEDIFNAGCHLLTLINDVLDVCRLEAGKLVLVEEEVLLEPLVAAAIQRIKARAGVVGLDLVQLLPPTLPHLMADKTKLSQILLNLLSNAVKFTERGGTVTFQVFVDYGKGVIIEVRDTGIGIPADKIAQVLQPFGQVENALTRRYEGAGLGLPLAKALVELHGGTFELHSEPGTGTRVRFTLPPSRILEKPVADNVIELPRAAIIKRENRAGRSRPHWPANAG